MTTLIGVRCTHRKVLSRDVLITRFLLGSLKTTAAFGRKKKEKGRASLRRIGRCIEARHDGVEGEGVAQRESACFASMRSRVRIPSPSPPTTLDCLRYPIRSARGAVWQRVAVGWQRSQVRILPRRPSSFSFMQTPVPKNGSLNHRLSAFIW